MNPSIFLLKINYKKPGVKKRALGFFRKYIKKDDVYAAYFNFVYITFLYFLKEKPKKSKF
ncbi:hypothetical protein TEHN7118_0987 [Tetragenococcus halophilus subsp. halophilus]|uniref:Uncharacterized protein n=1 Tax=Tetragenococcus halophilus subsp. halophilus TaxID=1513897 RepID=A0A2H6CT65_TETHA|nr:hypothetical protein TEHN7118_0987 [Tetragenococcus halophilus subsp. halophilus]